MLKTYRLNFSWDKDTEDWLRHQKKGSTLNICCGMSRVGDIRADLDKTVDPDIVCDVHYPPFRANSFDTVIWRRWRLGVRGTKDVSCSAGASAGCVGGGVSPG